MVAKADPPNRHREAAMAAVIQQRQSREGGNPFLALAQGLSPGTALRLSL
jgi:hypothetical protein